MARQLKTPFQLTRREANGFRILFKTSVSVPVTADSFVKTDVLDRLPPDTQLRFGIRVVGDYSTQSALYTLGADGMPMRILWFEAEKDPQNDAFVSMLADARRSERFNDVMGFITLPIMAGMTGLMAGNGLVLYGKEDHVVFFSILGAVVGLLTAILIYRRKQNTIEQAA